MKNLLLTLTCLLLAAQTNASDRYLVEVMIFAYLDENSAREEHWLLLEQWQQEEADAINTQLLMAVGGYEPISRLGGYTIGFFLFWLLTSSTCVLTCYFQRPCNTSDK